MKRKFALAITILAVLCCSCGENEENISQTDSTSTQTAGAENYISKDESSDEVLGELDDFDTRYEKIKESYPDKTVLVWLTDYEMKYEDDINEYLDENGYDFCIAFKCIEQNTLTRGFFKAFQPACTPIRTVC